MSTTLITTAYGFVTLVIVLAGVFAFRRQYNQSITIIQDRVISALRAENQTLTDQVGKLKEEIGELRATVSTIRVGLKRRGIKIQLNGQYVTFVETGVPKEMTLRVKPTAVSGISITNEEDDDLDVDVETDGTENDEQPPPVPHGKRPPKPPIVH